MDKSVLLSVEVTVANEVDGVGRALAEMGSGCAEVSSTAPLPGLSASEEMSTRSSPCSTSTKGGL